MSQQDGDPDVSVDLASTSATESYPKQAVRLILGWFREDRYLATRLVLPMGAIAAIVFIAACFADGLRQQILIDLGVASSGILVTVLYVDRISSRHEARRWVRAET